MYDKYEHDFVIMPYDVLQVEREQRQDTAPDGEKRVSCICTPSPARWTASRLGKIVRLAHRMGAPRHAITDHGVCQRLPEAMLATDAIHETDPNFKRIYGCEAYFVDDMIPAVYGTGLNGCPCKFLSTPKQAHPAEVVDPDRHQRDGIDAHHPASSEISRYSARFITRMLFIRQQEKARRWGWDE